MGRWNNVGHRVHDNSDGWCAADTDNIATRHNADCDAYAARIAELEAEVERRQQTLEGYYIDAIDAQSELARVRAESLRVVPDGDPVGLDAIFNSKIDFRLNYLANGVLMYNDGISMKSLVCHEFEEIDDDMEFQPVRLERWEDEG